MKVCSLCKANESLPSHPYCKRCLRDYTRAYRKTHQWPPAVLAKRLARKAALKALARGTIIRKPCEVCDNPIAEMHHDDLREAIRRALALQGPSPHGAQPAFTRRDTGRTGP